MRKLATFATLLIGLCLSGHAETLRVVVAGDGRAEYPWGDARPEDTDGLNQTINREICNAVKQEKANIFLWTGDIVNVNDRAGDKPEDKTHFLWNGLNKWHDIMGQLYDSDVKVLPVRGNHEVQWYKEKDKTPYEIANAAAIWKDVFRDLPANGPKGAKYRSLSRWHRAKIRVLDDFGGVIQMALIQSRFSPVGSPGKVHSIRGPLASSIG